MIFKHWGSVFPNFTNSFLVNPCTVPENSGTYSPWTNDDEQRMSAISTKSLNIRKVMKILGALIYLYTMILQVVAYDYELTHQIGVFNGVFFIRFLYV